MDLRVLGIIPALAIYVFLAITVITTRKEPAWSGVEPTATLLYRTLFWMITLGIAVWGVVVATSK